jgi:methylase of polypeptide subunit release factors
LSDIFGWNRPFTSDDLPQGLFEMLLSEHKLGDLGDGLYVSKYRVSTLNSMLFVHGSFPTTTEDAVFFGPDTYRFVEAIEAVVPNLRGVTRCVDVGCGAGAGAMTVAKLVPGAEHFMADINPNALECAKINAESAGFAKIVPIQSDLFSSINGNFDLIVSNPPYLVDAAKRKYRHGGGTYGEGLSLEIVDAAVQRLMPEGTLILYTGSTIVNGVDLFKETTSLFLKGQGVRVSYKEIDADVFGEELENEPYTDADRIAAVLLVVTKEVGHA